MADFSIAPLRKDQIDETVAVTGRAFPHSSSEGLEEERAYLLSLFGLAAAPHRLIVVACFVALADNRVVGSVRSCSHFAESEDGEWHDIYYLSQLAVDPPWQRRKIATALLTTMEKHLETEIFRGEPGALYLIDSTGDPKTENENEGKSDDRWGSQFYARQGYIPVSQHNAFTLKKTLNAPGLKPAP